MNKNKLILLVVIMMTFTVFFSSCGLLPEEESAMAPPVIEPVTVPYRTVTIERGDLVSDLVSSAKIESGLQQDLYYEDFGGHLGEINITRLGDVEEGDVLFGLNTNDLEYSKSMAYYNYASAKLNHQHLIDIGASAYEIQQASYSKSRAWLTYEKEKIKLESSLIVAPFTGKITYIAEVSIGDYVQARQVMCTISDNSDLTIVIPYNYARVNDFITGAAVDVTIKGVDYKGTIVQTPSDVPPDSPDEEKVTYIKVDGELADDVIIGDVANVTMILDSREDVLIISRSAVSLFQGRYIVYVLEDGVKVDKVIKVGMETATAYEVLEGLEEGDEIVIN